MSDRGWNGNASFPTWHVYLRVGARVSVLYACRFDSISFAIFLVFDRRFNKFTLVRYFVERTTWYVRGTTRWHWQPQIESSSIITTYRNCFTPDASSGAQLSIHGDILFSPRSCSCTHTRAIHVSRYRNDDFTHA